MLNVGSTSPNLGLCASLGIFFELGLSFFCATKLDFESFVKILLKLKLYHL